jgi:hypothetical protein
LLSNARPLGRNIDILKESAPPSFTCLCPGQPNLLIQNCYFDIGGRISGRHAYPGESSGASASQDSVCMGLKLIELPPRCVQLAHQFGGGVEIKEVPFLDLAGLTGHRTHCP